MSKLICPECGSNKLEEITSIGPSGTIYEKYECQSCGYHSAQVPVKPFREVKRSWKEKYDEQERD